MLKTKVVWAFLPHRDTYTRRWFWWKWYCKQIEGFACPWCSKTKWKTTERLAEGKP